MIRFGLQLGGGNSREKIQPMHLILNKMFKDSNKLYFNIIDNFVIVFRVEGPISTFGNEGPDCLEYLKKNKELGIDYVVPEIIWKQRDSQDLKIYFSQAIRDCFNILVEDAIRRGFVDNKERLVEDFNSKLGEFESLTFDEKNDRKS